MFQLVFREWPVFVCVCVLFAFRWRKGRAQVAAVPYHERSPGDAAAVCVCPRIFSRPADRPRVKKHILT